MRVGEKMFYEWDIAVPANTAEAAPKDTRVYVGAGVIVEGAVQFPRRCAGLVHVQLREGGYQLWPRNRTGSIKGDDAIVPMTEAYEIKAWGTELTILAWNTSELHAHTVTVRVVVLPKALAWPYLALQNLTNALRMALGI